MYYGITKIKVHSLEIFFCTSWIFFSWRPLNQWQMMSTWLPLKKIFINPTNESLREHFHFYITNKERNEMVHNIRLSHSLSHSLSNSIWHCWKCFQRLWILYSYISCSILVFCPLWGVMHVTLWSYRYR